MGDSPLRQIPAVHVLVESPALAEAVAEYGREAVVQAARAVLAEARDETRRSGQAPNAERLAAAVAERLSVRPTLYRSVLNATGVVLHTNLGRAPMPEAAWVAMQQALGYCDLELDLGTGKRASRLRGVEEPLVAVTGATAGMVVNNNAAAVLLGLAALAGDRPTAISRGHMVEIGGGFRLPTIMEASGSPLIEIGTTNRTHLKDYREAIDAGAALLLFVHRSNFVMSGYVTEPAPEQVIALAHEHGVPVMLDLGSGALLETAERGLPEELTVQRAVRMGFDLVCFSGDKLLGGPQAGYLVGDAAVIEKTRSHPLARALRCDKLQLAGCVATLELYRRAEAPREVPIWNMLGATRAQLRTRAEAWQRGIGLGDVVDSVDAVGGGSLPEGRLEGSALSLSTDAPDDLLLALRKSEPPVIGHIVDDRVLLHPRTVPKSEDERLVAAVRAALGR
ncbi:MAG: L-seryl-tRNA(Sec) selenium transferase [Deltaproteobacteria bacterium]|jgi:L-seryl-tRNA(Ser) seleniumtransferase|nr:L-seryl-tRNA(Sec) selenium transferase [Deltaproteobacteria bacterium]MBW2532783.1 L-seryl-tRNA(Sec) selenium transferase [Deltaproteobacteria bacterium]